MKMSLGEVLICKGFSIPVVWGVGVGNRGGGRQGLVNSKVSKPVYNEVSIVFSHVFRLV